MKLPSDEFIKFLFDHIRNLIISGTVIGIGTHFANLARGSQSKIHFLIAIVVALSGVLLIALNFTHGLNKMQQSGKPRWLIICSLPMYYVIAAAVLDVVSRKCL